MKRVFGILFILLIALALGMSVGDLRSEGVSMSLAHGDTPSAVAVGAYCACLPSFDAVWRESCLSLPLGGAK